MPYRTVLSACGTIVIPYEPNHRRGSLPPRKPERLYRPLPGPNFGGGEGDRHRRAKAGSRRRRAQLRISLCRLCRRIAARRGESPPIDPGRRPPGPGIALADYVTCVAPHAQTLGQREERGGRRLRQGWGG